MLMDGVEVDPAVEESLVEEFLYQPRAKTEAPAPRTYIGVNEMNEDYGPLGSSYVQPIDIPMDVPTAHVNLDDWLKETKS